MMDFGIMRDRKNKHSRSLRFFFMLKIEFQKTLFKSVNSFGNWSYLMGKLLSLKHINEYDFNPALGNRRLS